MLLDYFILKDALIRFLVAVQLRCRHESVSDDRGHQRRAEEEEEEQIGEEGREEDEEERSGVDGPLGNHCFGVDFGIGRRRRVNNVSIESSVECRSGCTG